MIKTVIARTFLVGLAISAILVFPKYLVNVEGQQASRHHRQSEAETKDEQQDDHMKATDTDVVDLKNKVATLSEEMHGDEMLVKGVSIAISTLYAYGFLFKRKEQHQA